MEIQINGDLAQDLWRGVMIVHRAGRNGAYAVLTRRALAGRSDDFTEYVLSPEGEFKRGRYFSGTQPTVIKEFDAAYKPVRVPYVKPVGRLMKKWEWDEWQESLKQDKDEDWNEWKL